MISPDIQFSIIVPTYNRAHLIGTAIRSVMDQTYDKWELLVCDDASSDNTYEVIRSFDDIRIKYYRLEENKGNAGARNLGVKNSLFQWITFLDSDDKLDPDYLMEFQSVIKNNSNFRFFFCGYRVVQNEKVVVSSIWLPQNDVRGSFFKDLRIGTGCGIVINRQCFDEIGFFDERLRAAVDTDFLLRLEMKYSFFVLEKVLISISSHQGPRVRKNAVALMEAYQFIIEKNNAIISRDKSLVKRWYYKLMWLQFHAKNFNGANESYERLKLMQCLNAKARIIHALFNILPHRAALFIHKKMSA